MNIITEILLSVGAELPVPEFPIGGDIGELYAWIIGVLMFLVIVAIPAIIIFYEKKLTKINERLDKVIEDSIKRMETNNDNDKEGLNKINEIVIKLKEIIVLNRK